MDEPKKAYGKIYQLGDLECNRPFVDYVNYYIEKYLDNGVIVDVGSGVNKIHPKFINIDPFATSNEVDIKAEMWDIPLEDSSVDLLVCFAALEHISKFLVPLTLHEFNRILKPGGAFAIIVPNLAWAMMRWLENPNVNWEMDMIFGSQDHEGEYHKTGFSVDIIMWYFQFLPELEILNIYDLNAYTQQNFGVIGRKKLED
jgi:predicted SAM-dependent methyltransferase